MYIYVRVEAGALMPSSKYAYTGMYRGRFERRTFSAHQFFFFAFVFYYSALLLFHFFQYIIFFLLIVFSYLYFLY